MRSTAIIFFLFLALFTKSQTFSTPFIIDSIATVAYSVVEKDSFLYVLGVNADTSIANGVRTYLAKFDKQGNKLSFTTFRPPQYIMSYAGSANSLIKSYDNGLISTGVLFDTVLRNSVLFLKFDSTGNVDFYKTYEPTIPNYRHVGGFKIIAHDSAYYIIGEVQLSNYYVQPLLIKTDLQGNLGFIKTYSGLPYLYGGGTNASLCILPNSNLLLCVARKDSSSNYWQTPFATCFLEVDTAGNLINQHCSTGINTYAHYNIAVTNDGNIISSGAYYSGPRIQGVSYPFTQYIAKWDTGFNKIWELNSGDPSYQKNIYTDFEQNLQNEIIACGQSVGDTGVLGGFNGILTKTSTSGQTEWRRGYQLVPPNAYGMEHYISDVILMQNGDIVAVGSWQSFSSNYHPFGSVQVGWLIRVHSDGCMDDGSCGLTGIDNRQQTIDNRQIQIRPNPANGSVRVEVENEMIGGELKVYDVTGKMLLQRRIETEQMQVDVSNMSKGLYVMLAEKQLKQARGKLVVE